MSGLSDCKPVSFIITKNRKASEAFYGNVLGLHQLPGDDFAAVFDLAGVPLRITEIPDWTPTAHPVLGWSVQDIVSTVKALKVNGVTFNIYPGMGQDDLGIWTSPDGKAKVAFFNDPDGNGLSLTQG
jgi:catechol 2,3-dioxygenase-like lactoylglutathione lyase family enzyme